jgi:nitric oxide reductase subunit B
MSNSAQPSTNENGDSDQISNVLKWILLATAIICFIVVGWGTYKTYQLAPPLPQQFLTPSGQIIMTENDIIAGKAGFQRPDLMDYGSLYGMGSYFGEDYTAKYLVRLGRITENEIAQQRFGKSFADLAEGDQYIVRKSMQQSLQQIDLSNHTSTLPQPVTKAVQVLQAEISQSLLNHNFDAGWTKAYSLDPQSALQTADFLIYSSLTTIVHRPGKHFSYTNNWPYEPSMGNTPTTNTFYWTWISFCFVFFGFGAVLYIYHRYLSELDNAPRTPILLGFKSLTASQKKLDNTLLLLLLCY